MLFTWSNNSEEILVDGQLGQRILSMLPEGHKACQWQLKRRTSEYKAAWRGSQKRMVSSSLSQPICLRALWEKLSRGPTLGALHWLTRLLVVFFSKKQVHTTGKLVFLIQRQALDTAPFNSSTILSIHFVQSALQALACANEVWISLHLSFSLLFCISFFPPAYTQVAKLRISVGLRDKSRSEGTLTGMALLTVVLYTQERIVYSVRHPSNNCSDSDTFSWKSSADLLAIPK